VRRPVGLRGEVEVIVMSDDPNRFEVGARLQTSQGTALTVRGVRTDRGRTIVSFEEVDDRTQAEALYREELLVSRSAVRELSSDEYWDFQLLGCRVTTRDGREVGQVEEVLHPPANDVLVVRGEGAERLIPLIRDVVRSIDPDARTIEIDPIPGLLEE
jgi:16S rRNA processing protein RimM